MRSRWRLRQCRVQETEFTENQDIVEYNIAQHHDDGVQCQCLGLGGSQEKGTEHDCAEREEGTEYTPMQVAGGCFMVDMFRGTMRFGIIGEKQ